MTPQASTAIARPLHVAIIMDGNGRWAAARGLPRTEGHRRGAAVVRDVVEAASRLDIRVLTLYAFSADNWRRPRAEVETLMAIFDEYVRDQVRPCLEHGIRFTLIGRRDRLLPSLRRNVEALEFCTEDCEALHLRLAIDYSARDAIWLAAERMIDAGLKRPGGELKPGAASKGHGGTFEEFARRIRSGRGEPDDVPDVDPLIRTGGEQRLSDFLLWESAYAELWFTDTAWPDFTAGELASALESFSRRERRFGGLPEVTAPPSPTAALVRLPKA
jgi:undecaprenyl diphosphate synthase